MKDWEDKFNKTFIIRDRNFDIDYKLENKIKSFIRQIRVDEKTKVINKIENIILSNSKEKYIGGHNAHGHLFCNTDKTMLDIQKLKDDIIRTVEKMKEKNIIFFT